MLSDEQIAAIEEIRESYGAELKAIAEAVKSGSLDRSDARSEMPTIAEAMKSELDAVLTDEQRTMIEEM